MRILSLLMSRSALATLAALAAPSGCKSDEKKATPPAAEASAVPATPSSSKKPVRSGAIQRRIRGRPHSPDADRQAATTRAGRRLGATVHTASACPPAPRASSPTRASSPKPPPTWWMPSAASWRPTRPNLKSSAEILEAREVLGWRFGLERMHRLCTLLGMPQRRFASVHVVGTNGKTSVARMTAALMNSHGAPAGAYLSPHIVSWRERVLIRGEPVDFHSWRRAYVQALADADVNAQAAAALAGHASLEAHARYLANTQKAREIPEAALPAFGVSMAPANDLGDSAPPPAESQRLAAGAERFSRVEPRGIEPLTSALRTRRSPS